MQSLWGLNTSTYQGAQGKTNECYSFLLSFNDIGNNKELELFYKSMYVWDQKILNYIFANKQKWLPGCNIKSVDALEALFTGVCSPRQRMRDGSLFPPALKLRIPKKGGQVDMTCIDKNGQPLDITSIKPSTDMRVIFRHRIDFKAKCIEVRNEPVLVQVMEAVRPTAFAHVL